MSKTALMALSSGRYCVHVLAEQEKLRSCPCRGRETAFMSMPREGNCVQVLVDWGILRLGSSRVGETFVQILVEWDKLHSGP